MSKIRKILTTGVVTLGMLGGPGVAVTTTGVVSAVADTSQLQENVDDEMFQAGLMSSETGMLKLVYTMPKGMTMRRMVVARPGEDKYRLLSELDELAMGMLDGEVEGLIIVEVENLQAQISGREFYGWVGFSNYDSLETGLRILERNPADVMYVGVVLEDATTGEESRYYYKVDYRSCAHQKSIINWRAVMCVTERSEGKLRLVPEDGLPLNDVPTWEEELTTLLQKGVKEYFEKLATVEALRDEGGEIDFSQIEKLEEEQVELHAELAKYPEVIGGEALKTDYATRLAALRRAVVGDQESQEPSEVTPGVTTGGGTGVTDGAAAGSATGVTTGVAVGSMIGVAVKVPATTGAAKVEATTSTGLKKDENAEVAEAKEAAVGTEGEKNAEQIEMEVPKLGGSWAERYGWALLIAGASLTGAAGWFLIGVLGKKRKQNKR